MGGIERHERVNGMSEKRYELFEAGPYRTLLPGEERLLMSVEGVSPVWVDGFGKMSESDMVICRREVRDGLSASDEVRQLREKLEAAKSEHKQAVEAGLKACEESRQLRERLAKRDEDDQEDAICMLEFERENAGLRERLESANKQIKDHLDFGTEMEDENVELKKALAEVKAAKDGMFDAIHGLHSAIGSLIQAQGEGLVCTL